MNKQELISKIKQLDSMSQDERAYLINLINTKKKYGLVWEDKPEDVEEQLRNNLPVLKEVKDKAIINGEDNPNHILIESDNLHALVALTYTHQDKIDAMYFDPPYNTGSKDWRYNNDYVAKEDSFKHSKWISMMSKRLKIAKTLLKNDGVICVTIDDYEMPRLFILMEEIFGEDNHLGTIVIRNNPSGRSTVKGMSIAHEYGVFFGKSSESKVGRLERNEKQISRFKFFDEFGPFEWVNFRKHGGTREESRSMYYPIFISEDSCRIPELNWDDIEKEWIAIEKPKANESIIYPIDDKNKDRRWKWGIDRSKNSPEDFCVKKDKNGELGVYIKSRMTNDGVLPLTWWDKNEYSATAYGTNLIKDIFGELQVFTYPKSLYAVIDSIKVLSNKKDAIILDIFAGSGTTLHATMSLNEEDGGNRQCILVTNNENNICEEVTYERNKKIIEGYNSAKGITVSGLEKNNLRYFKSINISREKSIKNKKELTLLATEMLCIKEDCYTPIASKAKWYSAFADTKSKFIVIYDDIMIEESIEIIKQMIQNKVNNNPIKVYVFSNGQYPYTEDFEEVLEYINLCALPDAIYKAYQNVLPKKKKEFIPFLEDDIPGEEENLFNQEKHNS
jgi:adenine-specific DNA-methyltransferase